MHIIAQRVEEVASTFVPGGTHGGYFCKRVVPQTPDEDAGVGNIVVSASCADVAHIYRVSEAIEGRIEAGKRLPITLAQINQAIFRSGEVHMLRRGKQLKEFDDVRIPTRDISH